MGKRKNQGKGNRSGKAQKPKTRTGNQRKPTRTGNGRTLQTRDEYFEGAGNFRKKGYENKGLYRKAVVVDSNKQGDLAVVKLRSEGLSIPGVEKSKYRPFVETKDNEGNPIRPGRKFKLNPTKNNLSKHAVAEIKKTVFKESKDARDNRRKVRKMKGRR